MTYLRSLKRLSRGVRERARRERIRENPRGVTYDSTGVGRQATRDHGSDAREMLGRSRRSLSPTFSSPLFFSSSFSFPYPSFSFSFILLFSLSWCPYPFIMPILPRSVPTSAPSAYLRDRKKISWADELWKRCKFSQQRTLGRTVFGGVRTPLPYLQPDN